MRKLNDEATEIAIGVAKALCREQEVPVGEWEDCIQEGVAAALAATRLWKGQSLLSTFLYRRVRGAIMDYRAKQQNGGTGGRDARVRMLSLYEEVHGKEDFDGEPLTYDDIVAYESPPAGYGDPVDELVRQEDENNGAEEQVARLLAPLSSADRALIMRYFGIDGPEANQRELSLDEDVSQAAISKRIRKILESLRDHAEQIGYKW